MSEEHVNSWYAATANFTDRFPALAGNLSSDVCIVGGGYTGLSAAIHLRKRGYSVTLLEANRLGWGASGRNGGHVGTGQRADQHILEKMVGKQRAKMLWDLGLEGVHTVCELIDEFNIQCELKKGNLHTASTKKAAAELREEVDHLRAVYDYGDLRYIETEELAQMTSAQGFHGAILDTAARHLHPLNYCLGLARAARELGVTLHENSRVTHYEENAHVLVHTDSGQVKCEHLLLACNGYLGKLEPRVAGQIMPINNYVIATEPLSEATARQLIRDDTSMSDSRFVINYWKLSADNRLLFGGGESYTSRFPKDIPAFVRPYMLEIYPELADTTIEYGWGGTLAITLNRMPALGRVSPRVLYAHGYSGHGVPIATLAGKLLAETIAGTAERFDVMANVPTPKFPGGTLLRWPGLVAGMLYYSLRDRLG
ncbi:gamma-glutamylputrescine oxidoreductase [gamma proteobacterium NOR5-3]|nr:gamma-glutamylputrescine oxidoreductase [gamma proteobacterium NOR5-3]